MKPVPDRKPPMSRPVRAHRHVGGEYAWSTWPVPRRCWGFYFARTGRSAERVLGPAPRAVASALQALRLPAVGRRRRTLLLALLVVPTALVPGCGARSELDESLIGSVAWVGSGGADAGSPDAGGLLGDGGGSLLGVGGAWSGAHAGATSGAGGAFYSGASAAGGSGGLGASSMANGGALDGEVGGVAALPNGSGGVPLASGGSSAYGTGGSNSENPGSGGTHGEEPTTGGTHGEELTTGGTDTNPTGDCGPLIDDLEDGSGVLCAPSDRVGVWYACNDGTGTQVPEPTTPGVPILPERLPEPRGTSEYAMHTSGGGFRGDTLDWGAGIGVDLAFDGAVYGRYDASRYGGIHFWARSDTASPMKVRISTASTTLADFGGRCEAEPCSPVYVDLLLSPAWTEYSLRFLDFSGLPIDEFDEVVNIQFFFDGLTPFDAWIDDLSFITELPDCCSDLPQCQGGITYADPELLANQPNEIQSCSGACYVLNLSISGQDVSALSGLECLGRVQGITLDGTAASDLSPLGAAPSLSSLSVSNQTVDSWRPLGGAGRLTQLMLTNVSTEDWASLDALTALTYLTASGLDASGITVSGLPALEYLTLGPGNVPDVALSDLPSLSFARLSGIQSDSVTVTRLGVLTSLDFVDSTIGELSLGDLGALISLGVTRSSVAQLPIRDLPAFASLQVSEATLGSTSLRNLPSFSQLVIAQSQFQDVTVSSVPALAGVSLTYDGLTELPAFLSGLQPIQSLSLDGNAFTELDLSNLPVCTYLSLQSNRLTELKAENLETLERLYVASNALATVSITNLPALTDLAISQNPIASLDLSGAPALRQLYAQGCGLTDLSPLGGQVQLVYVDASDNSISNVLPLQALPRLAQLVLRGNQLRSLSPFLEFQGLSPETTSPYSRSLDVSSNPFDCAGEAANLAVLRSMGVWVVTSCPE